MTPFPSRTPNRAKYYDYTNPGRYFVTFCTLNRECLLGKVIGADDLKDTKIMLFDVGQAVKSAIDSIPTSYGNVFVDKYVIMPNHVHMIVSITERRYSLSTIIGQTKRKASALIGRPIWQRHFHDHIIRNKDDFMKAVKYIDNNPKKWSLDKYYQEPYLSI